MRKIILATCLLALSTITANAQDYDFAVDGICYNTTDSAKVTVEVTYGEAPTLNVTIPTTVEYQGKTYNVMSTNKDALPNCASLTKVQAPLKSIIPRTPLPQTPNSPFPT